MLETCSLLERLPRESNWHFGGQTLQTNISSETSSLLQNKFEPHPITPWAIGACPRLVKTHQSYPLPPTPGRMPPVWAPLLPPTQVLPIPLKNNTQKPSQHLRLPIVSRRPQAPGEQRFPLIITAAVTELCPAPWTHKISLCLPTTLCNGCYYWPHVTNEETEAQG